jgi:hypothetical protein
LEAFAAAHLGDTLRVRFCGWDHAESRVWALETAGARRAFLKVPSQWRKFRQERHAYRAYLPGLRRWVPNLIAVCEAPAALLLTAKPGTLVQHTPLTSVEEHALYCQAGAFLRVLHAQPLTERDPMPLAEALRRRAQAWCERAHGLVDAALVDWVHAQAAEAAKLAHTAALPRVPTHGDFSPRNWLVADGALYVIDFEHAKPDLWLADVLKLWCAVWWERPDLARSFFAGYGRPPTALEETLLERLAALHALSTVVWARAHADAAFEAQGLALLRRLQERFVGA